MKSGRRISFDFGDVRIGVAISDSSGTLASPLSHLKNIESSIRSDLIALYEEFEPIYTALGYPLHLSGKESLKSASVLNFATKLVLISSAPIYLIDERMTSTSAAKVLRSAGLSSKEARGEIDSEAAVAILQSALNQERLQGEPLKRFSELAQ